jgi:hypothetical protein
MGLKAKAAEKRAEAVGSHAALETKNLESGHHQAKEPTVTFLGFPKPRLVMTVPTIPRLLKPMPTAFRQPSLMGKMSNALLAIFTHRVENLTIFRPKSHGGQSSARWLKS